MDENKIQVRKMRYPSRSDGLIWIIECPDDSCYSVELGINGGPGWAEQETAMRVAVKHALDQHPKPFAGESWEQEEPMLQHEHDASCSFGNPQCPAFAEEEKKRGFLDWLMRR